MDTVLLILCFILVALASAALTYAVMLRRAMDRPARPAAASTAAPEPVVEDDDPEEEAMPKDALPIDPLHPPRTVIYNPKDNRQIPHCNCHDRELAPGTEYLWWPTDDGKVMIFCADRT